jgi:DnaJ-class molecular chaperone
VIEFTNVEELPQVPNGHIRELRIEGNKWFYSDTPEYVKAKVRKVTCPVCTGSGLCESLTGFEVVDCLHCDGTGKMRI